MVAVSPVQLLSGYQREPSSSGDQLTIYAVATLFEAMEATDCESEAVTQFGSESRLARLIKTACVEWRSARGVK